MDALVVQIRTGAAFGGEELVADRIIDDAGNDLFPAGQSERHAKYREAVGEIGGAIQRINVPTIVRVGFLAPAFFTYHRVCRAVAAKALDDKRLRPSVRFSDQV